MGSPTCLLVDFMGFVGLVSVSGPRPIVQEFSARVFLSEWADSRRLGSECKRRVRD